MTRGVGTVRDMACSSLAGREERRLGRCAGTPWTEGVPAGRSTVGGWAHAPERCPDVRAAIADAGRRAVKPLALERDVVRQLTHVVPFDLWCGLTTDPATGQPTGGYHDEGLPPTRMPRLLEIENAATPDFLALSTLARPRGRVRTLAEATGGDLHPSGSAPAGCR